jgi:hypothetical protein
MNEQSELSQSQLRLNKIASEKAIQTAGEAICQGLNPFLCVVILQTFDGLSIQATGDYKIVPPNGTVNELIAKINDLITDYCSSLPTLQKIPDPSAS